MRFRTFTNSLLRQRRRSLEVSQRTAGKAVGVTPQFFNNFENNKSNIPHGILVKLKDLYNLTAVDILLAKMCDNVAEDYIIWKDLGGYGEENFLDQYLLLIQKQLSDPFTKLRILSYLEQEQAKQSPGSESQTYQDSLQHTH